MYEQLSQKLHSILLPLVGGNIKTLERVEVQNPTVFPFVSVVEDDTAEDEVAFDTTSNVAVYRFRVRVVQSLADVGMREGCRTVRMIVDDVLETIRQAREWGDCIVSVSTGVRWGYMNEEHWRVADISVSFRVLLDTM